jgi:exopolysaccharide production protein ExoQ
MSGLQALAARARDRPGPMVAWAAAFSLTFLTTLGPVYSVRLAMGPVNTDWVDDITVQVFFGALYAVLLVMLVGWGRRRALPRALAVTLVAFCAVVVASTLWSADPTRTLTQAILLCMTAAAGVAVGRTTSVRSQITAVFASQQLGALLSVIAILRHAPRSTDQGNWVGIYLNRNLLGPVAVLGLMATAGCAGLVWARREAWSGRLVVSAFGGLGAAALLDSVLLKESGSLTPTVGFAIAAFGVGAVLVVRRLTRGWKHAAERIAAITLAALATLIAVAWVGRSALIPLVGKTPTLESRTTLWSYLRTFADQRPVRGWGWLAIWHVPAFQHNLSHYTSPLITRAHNGFLEVYVGTGLLGLVLLVAFSLVLLWTVTRRAAAHAETALWPFALVLYALSTNQTESFIGANLLPWVLLTMAAATVASPWRRARSDDGCDHDRSDDRGNGGERADVGGRSDQAVSARQSSG